MTTIPFSPPIAGVLRKDRRAKHLLATSAIPTYGSTGTGLSAC
jgi:hypothetical protein